MIWLGAFSGLLLTGLLVAREIGRARHPSVRSVRAVRLATDDPPSGSEPENQHWLLSIPLVSVLALVAAASLIPRLWGLLT